MKPCLTCGGTGESSHLHVDADGRRRRRSHRCPRCWGTGEVSG